MKALYIELNQKIMNKAKVDSVLMNAVLKGAFGGLVCVIEDSLFNNTTDTNFKGILKKFRNGFLVGSVWGGLSELLYYDSNQEFIQKIKEGS